MTSSQDFNDQYNLSPPPPRNVYSSTDPSRVTFPDFNSDFYVLPNGFKPSSPASGLRLFMRHLFHFGEYWSHSTFIQFKLIAGLAACLFILFCWVLLRRLKKKTFWMVRLVKRSNGTLIAPNATVGFTVFEGVYAIALIAFLFEYSRYESGKLPKGTLIWALVAWSPLITGAWFGLIGTIFAIPTTPKRTSSFWKAVWKAALSPRPLIINLLCAIIPLIQITTIIIPAATSNSEYLKAYRQYQEWNSKYSSLEVISEEMIQEAYQIWKRALDAYLIVAIGFTVWSCWAILISAAYGGCGFILLKTIAHQIRTLRKVGVEDTLSSPSPTTTSPVTPSVPLTPFSTSSKTLLGSPVPKTPILDPKWQNEGVVSARLERNSSLKSLSANASGDVNNSETYTTPSPKSHHQSLRSLSRIDTNSRTALSRGWNGSQDEGYQRSTTEFPRQEVDTANSGLIFSDRELVEDLPNSSFFPRMKPSAFASFRRQQPLAVSSNSTSRWNPFSKKDKEVKIGKVKRSEIQARFLEKVFYNFLINFIAKFGGELAFSGVALYLTLQAYASAELNEVGKPVEIAILWVGYGSILFGSITLGSIVARGENVSYEPATQAYLLVSEQNQAKKLSSFDVKRSTSLPRIARKVSRSLLNNRHGSPSATSLEAVELSPIPGGGLAERRINRRNLGLGIDDEGTPVSSSSRSNPSSNPLLIQQTVEQVIDLDSSPNPPSTKSPSLVSPSTQRNTHARLESSSTAYSSNEDLKQKGSFSSTRSLSKSPSRPTLLPQSIEVDVGDEDGSTAFSPSTPWSPFSSHDSQQSPYINPPSPVPNQVNSNRFFGPLESSIDMENNRILVETTFPSASPLISSPTRSVQRQDSSHSLSNSIFNSFKGSWRPQSPQQPQVDESGSSSSSHGRLKDQPRKLSWTAPTEWRSPSPDEQLVAEQQRLERERERKR